MMDIAAVVVIYNSACGDSACCQALEQLSEGMAGKLNVLLFDNSERDFGNLAFCRRQKWTYLGGSGNLGLSRAYNAALDYLHMTSFRGIICLLDDDTRVSDTYFRTLAASAEQFPERDIFVPILRSGGRIVSPQIISQNQRASFFPDVRSCLAYRGIDLYAFNAGMAVRMRVFERYRYDEHLFLDGIDYCFLRDMYAGGRRLMVLDCVLEQGFSGLERPEKTQALSRFQNYARDFACVLHDQQKAYGFLVGKRALHLTLQYRDAVFLRIFLRSRRQMKIYDKNDQNQRGTMF